MAVSTIYHMAAVSTIYHIAVSTIYHMAVSTIYHMVAVSPIYHMAVSTIYHMAVITLQHMVSTIPYNMVVSTIPYHMVVSSIPHGSQLKCLWERNDRRQEFRAQCGTPYCLEHQFTTFHTNVQKRSSGCPSEETPKLFPFD